MTKHDDTALLAIMAQVLDEAGLSKSATALRAGGELSSWQQGLALTAMRRAVQAERERIAAGLEAEADNSPCAEDASVHRGAAWLVRADFSYEEAERLQDAAEKSKQPVT